MMRHCDGTDPNLRATDGSACSCGLEFDDVDCSTVYPHTPLAPPLTKAEREEFLAFLGDLGGAKVPS